MSLTLRLAGIPLNSELHLVADESRKGDGQQKVTLCIQFGDKARKMGEFTANETLWKVIETLFAGDEEIHDNNKMLSVNHLNRLVGSDIRVENTHILTVFALVCRQRYSKLDNIETDGHL